MIEGLETDPHFMSLISGVEQAIFATVRTMSVATLDAHLVRIHDNRLTKTFFITARTINRNVYATSKDRSKNSSKGKGTRPLVITGTMRALVRKHNFQGIFLPVWYKGVRWLLPCLGGLHQ